MDKNKAISGYEKIFDDGYRAGRASVVLPHPCDGELYKSWTSSDYFAKIAEEHLEVIGAYKTIEKSGKCPTKEEQDHFFKECTDLIVATTGLMHYLGCDEKMRQQYMKEINESNAKRDGGRRFANEELPASALAFPVFKDMEKSKTVKEDKVNHPRHYDLPGGGQTIDVIDDMLDDAEVEGYYKGNIIKYIARYKGKGGAESLKKARWYLDKLIALKETQEEIDAE